MKHKVNVAFQVLPRSKDKSTYDLVDIAIDVIKNSGIKYRVCPFETVLEGEYDEIMSIIKKVQEELDKLPITVIMAVIVNNIFDFEGEKK